MICCECKSEMKLVALARIQGEYLGERLWVSTPAYVCLRCGWTEIADSQIEEYLAKLRQAYHDALSWRLTVN